MDDIIFLLHYILHYKKKRCVIQVLLLITIATSIGEWRVQAEPVVIHVEEKDLPPLEKDLSSETIGSHIALSCPSQTLQMHQNDTILSRSKREPLFPFDGCRVVINEVNSDSNINTNQNQFIELALVCVKAPNKRPSLLNKFKLIVVRGSDSVLVFVADLRSIKLNARGHQSYAVVGSSAVPNVDMDWNDKNVQSIYNNVGSSIKFPTGDDSPYGIILLFGELQELRDVKLTSIDGKYNPRKIDKFLSSKILKNSQDMIIFGRKTITNRCSIFEELWKDDTLVQFPHRVYLLRDFDERSGRNDYSLNRCCVEITPFKPEAFQLDKVSPGIQNPCNGAIVILEDIILDVTPAQPPSLEPAIPPPACLPDHRTATAKRLRDVEDNTFFQQRDALMQQQKKPCNKPGIPRTEFSESNYEADRYADLQRNINPTQAASSQSQQTPTFDQSWLTLSDPFFPVGTNPLRKKEIQQWAVVKREGSQVSVKCAVCSYQIENHFPVEFNRRTKITSSDGHLLNGKSQIENYDLVVKHNSDKTHLATVAFQHSALAKEHQDNFFQVVDELETANDGFLQPTFRMIRTVYFEARNGLPFRKHPEVVSLQKANGVNLGIHHYHRKAAAEITEIISEEMHNALLHNLIKNKYSFTFLVDTTTDTTNTAYLIVYIQTLENEGPVMHFYRLIELPKGESGKAMVDALWEQIDYDTTPSCDFAGYTMQYLAAISSDAASSMIGRSNSFRTWMEARLNRQIPVVTCLAHKLQNAFKRAITSSADDDLKYFNHNEKTYNKFYGFYSSRGSKRWGHFKDICIDLGLKPHRLAKHIDIRWASSHRRVVKRLYDDYDALRFDLPTIAMDTEDSWTNAAQKTAEDLFNYLQDKTWTVVLHELLDLLEIFAKISARLQTRAGVIAGSFDAINEGMKSIMELRSKNGGTFLTSFLKKTVCTTDTSCNPDTGCTLVQYEKCKAIKYKEIHILEDKDEEVREFKLSKIRNKLYDSIIFQFQNYFNLEELEAFEVLNQQKYDLDCSPSSITNDVRNIAVLCNFYHINEAKCNLIKQEWPVFKQELMSLEYFVQNLKTDIEFFWPLVLKNDDKLLTSLTENIKFLIRLMLTTPYSNSEPERGFSYVTKLTEQRELLYPKLLDDLVRIHENGDNDYKSFNVFRVAKVFLCSGHCRVDDKTVGGGRRGSKPEHGKFLPRSSYF